MSLPPSQLKFGLREYSVLFPRRLFLVLPGPQPPFQRFCPSIAPAAISAIAQSEIPCWRTKLVENPESPEYDQETNKCNSNDLEAVLVLTVITMTVGLTRDAALEVTTPLSLALTLTLTPQ